MFVIASFFTIASYQFFKNDWIFINHGLFCQGKCSLQHTNLSTFKSQFLVVEIVRRMF